MLTLFTIPKPFQGHIDVIQRNAIRSWTRLRPECEIIIAGDDSGVEEFANELGVLYIKEIARNEYGTPLLDDLFAKAQTAAKNDLVCYVNADIILLNNFMTVVQHFSQKPEKFLLVGQRWDLDINVPINFDLPDWQQRLVMHLRRFGKLHHVAGLDYFVFRRGLYAHIPPFAIGRCMWDNWLIYGALENGASVIDVTDGVLVIHQNHDYSHVAYSETMKGRPGIDAGPERKRNIELAGGVDKAYDLRNATQRVRLSQQTDHAAPSSHT